MPRPVKQRLSNRSKTGGWIAPVQLSEADRNDLLDILNCDEQDERVARRIIGEIEESLGFYQFFKEELDESPRPAQRAAELKPLLKSCKDTLREFRRLSEDARQDVLNQAEDLKHHRRLNRFPGQLARMTASLDSACRQLEKSESRHGKTHRALKGVIEKLAFCFDKHYMPHEEDRSSQLSEFIRSALKAGMIGRFSRRTIARHLQSPSLFS